MAMCIENIPFFGLFGFALLFFGMRVCFFFHLLCYSCSRYNNGSTVEKVQTNNPFVTTAVNNELFRFTLTFASDYFLYNRN